MYARRHGVRLADETSINIGGDAREFYVPVTLGEFRQLLGRLHERRPFILGGGCNTLFPDEAFDRPVVSTARLRRVEIEEREILAECGARIGSLVIAATEAGMGGLEGLVGVPGTIGGAVVMNAGGSGWSLGDCVVELGLIPLDGGDLVRIPGGEVPWGYRSWNLQGYVVGWVRLRLEPADVEQLRRVAAERFHRKRESQPLGRASAGCVFKNPPGRAAAAMIDALGLKGMRRGSAMVSQRHANFIVNVDGQARCADVKALIDEIRSRVEDAYDVHLETEIVLAEE